jgi:hypothetical protein
MDEDEAYGPRPKGYKKPKTCGFIMACAICLGTIFLVFVGTIGFLYWVSYLNLDLTQYKVRFNYGDNNSTSLASQIYRIEYFVRGYAANYQVQVSRRRLQDEDVTLTPEEIEAQRREKKGIEPKKTLTPETLETITKYARW